MPPKKARKPAKKKVSAKAAAAPANAQKSRSLVEGFPIRTTFAVVGVLGLAAIAISLFGPRRFRDEVILPIGAATYTPIAAAVAPQADRVWEETRAWRDRVGRILESINTEEVRELVASRLSQWIERFR
jgi:hypothetical protein